jgi:hypothetical protein
MESTFEDVISASFPTETERADFSRIALANAWLDIPAPTLRAEMRIGVQRLYAYANLGSN